MNTKLLRLARRHRGVRRWAVPGFGNCASLVPSHLTFTEWGTEFRWPARDDRRGEHLRAVDLNLHLKMAKAAARELVA